jgi:hypothetical protein
MANLIALLASRHAFFDDIEPTSFDALDIAIARVSIGSGSKLQDDDAFVECLLSVHVGGVLAGVVLGGRLHDDGGRYTKLNGSAVGDLAMLASYGQVVKRLACAPCAPMKLTSRMQSGQAANL